MSAGRQPASTLQAQFFLAEQLHPGTALNTITHAVHVEGPLDAARLSRALETLRDRHVALRTRLQAEDDSIVRVFDDEDAAAPALEVRSGPEGTEAWASSVETTRSSLSPGTTPWKAVLFRHDATHHTFVFAAHRCVWDESSTGILGTELSALYNTDGEAGLSGLPDDAGQVAPVPVDSAEGARLLAAALDDVPPVHEFPLKTSRPRLVAVAADAVAKALDDESAKLVELRAKEWDVEPLVVTVAAATYVLAQYAGQRRIAVGMPFSLRDQHAERPFLGSHTAMLPLAFDAGAAPTFEGLTAEFAAAHRAAAAHSATPFHEVVQQRGAKSDPAANPLFQVGFARDERLILALEGCEAHPTAVPAPPQQLDLFFEVGSTGLRLGYATRIIDGGMAAALCDSIGIFLDAALGDPGRAVADLPLLSAESQDALLSGPNRTDEPSFLEQDLYRLVTKHCQPSNQKVALVCDGSSVTYAELGTSVESLAARLREAEVGPEELIGICLPRSPDMLASILAVLRCGNAYVPLDPAFPRERLTYMAEHSRLRHIVTTSTLRPLFESTDAVCIELDRIDDPPDETATPARPPAEAPAYVIYTSGSTGRPKGVVVPRSAVANFLQSMVKRPGLEPSDRLCAVTTLSFDIAVLELLAPLCVGGTVVIATDAESRDPRLLASLLETESTTVLQATPVTWHMLCASGWTGSDKLVALCGGEALSPSLARILRPRVKSLWNMYGPTETTVWSTCQLIDDPEAPISVGTPIHNTAVYVLDEHERPVPLGVEGQLFIGGAGVTLGYLHNEDLTRQRFIADPFRPGGRMYDTGDRARLTGEGRLEVLGRRDFQVKLRGFRIELGEIEMHLSSLPGVEQVVAVVRRDNPDNPELAAYFTLGPGSPEPTVAQLREHSAARLPGYMVPSRFVCLEEVPLTPNGKVDRASLPRPNGAAAPATPRTAASLPRSDVERELVQIWRDVLSLQTVGINDNFFELGGTSLAAFSVVQRIAGRFGTELSVLTVFEHPTIADLAQLLKGNLGERSYVREAYDRAHARRSRARSKTEFDVAVVGVAGRFPGARTLQQLWENLREGRETITFFEREELDPLVPAHDRNDPAYIAARGVLEDSDRFDAAFFGINPREAELMDPQLRVFMETAWEALENAGYVGDRTNGIVGLWAGMGNNFYYLYNVLTRPDKLALMGEIAAEIANEKDHIAPRVSHKLNLTGPSISVHTACSTALVVVENAYQALVTHQVDMALAGASDVRTPAKSGQRYEDGGIFTADGHCRPFDAGATGTMFGDGVGAVVLKRLDDAVRDNDTIHAIIKGAAVNHDGSRKVSYLAPSVEGQARVIAAAMALGDVDPDTVTMIEAHGTATPIGDPIEVEALTRVYRAFTQRRGFCSIGSIKGNFGHATTAAGIAGLLKVVLSLRHHQIPPTVHYTRPNPRIDFDSSPFFVSNRLLDWKPDGVPRRAGVSSFGFCGTNAHVVLEEALPPRPVSPPSRPWQLLLVSARHAKALEEGADRLGASLREAGPEDLADAAYTTHVGRKRFEHRRCAVASTAAEATELLGQAAGGRSLSLKSEAAAPPVAFMFPGQGSQYVNMGRELYQGEESFRESADRCAKGLAPFLGCDLRDFLFPDPEDAERATQSLNNTFYTQPAIFTISYSLAKLLEHWGVRPGTFIGHSIGEFVGATLSGVMELEEALRLVATRGRLMQGLPSGSMLSVRLPVDQLETRLPDGVDLAAINGPQLCVLAGPTEPLERLSAALTAEDVKCRMLHTSHAFHSSMMEPVVEPFLRTVEGVRLSAPRAPFVSTVTGEWIKPEEVTDPSYWARHLRSPVRFSQAVQTLLKDSAQVLVECGPRRTCTTLALQHRPSNPDRIVSSMPDSAEPADEYPAMLLAIGALWLNGCDIDWAAFHEGETRRRVPLPSYAFQRKRYWIQPGNTVSFGLEGETSAPAAGVPARPEEDDVEHAPPASDRDDVMTTLVALMEEVLGERLEDLDDEARFIALGLDSLLLTQLARMVRSRFEVDVTFRQLTEKLSTPMLLANAIRESTPKPSPAGLDGDPEAGSEAPLPAPGSGTAPKAKPPGDGSLSEETPPVVGARLGRDEHGNPAWFVPDPDRPGKYLKIEETATVGPFEATPSQREMWRVSEGGPDAGRAYNDSISLHLSGALDEGVMEAALQALADRHEALRGRFADGGATFVIEPTISVPVARHDLEDLPRARRSAALTEIESSDSGTGYHLGDGPLFRATIARLGPQEHVVILSAHRAVCDGWSLDVLLFDLGQLYTALARGLPGPPPAKHVLSDYDAFRATPQFSARAAASREFWGKALRSERSAQGNGGEATAVVRAARAQHGRRLLAPDLVDSGKRLARDQGLSFFTVLLATQALLLHRSSGLDDLAIGVPVAGQPDADMEECVGPLAHLLPVRCRLENGISFADLCQTVSGAILDARENAAVDLSEIAVVLAAQGHPGPMVDAVFTHVQQYAPGKLVFGDCEVDYRPNARTMSVFDLEMTAFEGHQGLELIAHARADGRGRGWVDSRLDEFEALLRQGCAKPSEAPVLPGPGRRRSRGGASARA